MTQPTISLAEIKECLDRSGYLMESRIVRRLDEAGYFVEPNQAVLDPRSGKSREIDILAEFYDFDRALQHSRMAVKTYFIIEVVNNSYPFVLLTKRPRSPNANVEDYVKWGYTPNDSPVLHDMISEVTDRKDYPAEAIFSQFCQVTRKSGKPQLMATHPDDVYSGLLKVAEYVEGEVTRFEEFDDKYWRIFFWRPIVVIKGPLIVVDQQPDGSVALDEATAAYLEFNWHAEDRPRTTIFDVVCEDALMDHMEAICREDAGLEETFFQIREANKSTSEGTVP